ncbi:hypothetical protein [Microbacterium sp.]|uniref:hypothetical protein n=1 Tax=Microbacterium sp. TaxID=51671 RepID=UPI0026060983|nr:hypothetical protein [Microbacterium sp.]
MSGESTDHAQNPDGKPDAPPTGEGAVDAVVPGYEVPKPEMVDVPDAESAAADFAVPPPPTFETPSVPAAPAERSRAGGAASDVVPPPTDATWSAERTWKPRLTWSHHGADETADAAASGTGADAGSDAAGTTGSNVAGSLTVQEKIERASRAGQPDAAVPSSRAALRESATAERVPVAPSEGTEGGSYRGWTITIFGGLAVLFFGAVGFMVFLGFSS